MSERQRRSTVAEPLPQIRWTRSGADITKPPWLQQQWKLTEHFTDNTSAIRYEWRDVPTVPP